MLEGEGGARQINLLTSIYHAIDEIFDRVVRRSAVKGEQRDKHYRRSRIIASGTLWSLFLSKAPHPPFYSKPRHKCVLVYFKVIFLPLSFRSDAR